MNSAGLPGGLPIPPGVSGSLTVRRATLVDGITGRTFNIFIPTSGGSGALTSCTITVGALPAGLSIVVANDPVTGTPISCKISGTITAGAGVVNFTVQVQDGSSPVQTATQAFSITVRAEFAVTTAGALPNEGRQGSTFGATANGPEPIATNVSATVGNAPLTSCVFVLAGNPGFNLTPAPLSASACPLSSGATLLSASGTFTFATNAGVTVQDTAILDPLALYAGLTVAQRTVVPAGTVKNASAITIKVNPTLVASFVQGTVTPNTNPNSTLLDGVDARSYGVINANAGAPNWSVVGGLGAGAAGVANYSWCVSSGGAAVTAIAMTGISTSCAAPTAGVNNVKLTSAAAAAGAAAFAVDVTDAGNLRVASLTITQGTSTINVRALLAINFAQAGNTTAASTLLDGVNAQSYGVINANAGAPIYAGSGGLGSGTAGTVAYQWCISVNGAQVTAIGLSGISTNCAAPTTGSPVLLSSAAAITGTATYTVQLSDTGNEATPLGTVTAGPSVINIQITMTATFVQGVVTPNTNPNSTLLDGSTGLSYGVINANAGAPTYTVAGGLGAGAA
ncbi:MAG TPA: hypothetical protein VGQ11_01225, partial [Candidatus Acidoferrales bacterium]|nr:hypothetical protein [Candidatus Acidoferrales bacterium]